MRVTGGALTAKGLTLSSSKPLRPCFPAIAASSSTGPPASGGGQPMLPASAVLLPAALPSTSSMQKGAVRFVVNDKWGQVSLSGGPADPKSQTGRTVRNLFVWLWFVVNDRKFPVRIVFFSHINQPAVLLHKPATIRTSQPNRLQVRWGGMVLG